MTDKPILRIAPSLEAAMKDPAYNPLHYAYLLWVDYLRASTEADKQQLLVDAAAILTVYPQCGREGEEIIALLAQAITSRGRAYGRFQGLSSCWVETAIEDNRHKFSIRA